MLIDDILPEYDITEVHHIDIRAEPERVYRAIHEVTTAELPLFRLLMGIRMLPATLSGRRVDPLVPDGPLVHWTSEMGILLAEQPDQELVFGIAGQFWKLRGAALAHIGNAEEFAAFDRPGYTRAATNFHLTQGADGVSTQLRTETRIQANDAEALRKFRAYWFVIYPGSSLIRREWLRIIQRRAESGRQLINGAQAKRQ